MESLISVLQSSRLDAGGSTEGEGQSSVLFGMEYVPREENFKRVEEIETN